MSPEPKTTTTAAQSEPERMAAAAINALITSPSPAFTAAATTRKRSRLVYMSRGTENPTPTPSIPDTSTFVSSLTKLLWGPSLPPQLVISTVKSTWTTAWQVIMSQMAPSDAAGSYNRPASKFRFGPPEYPSALAAARLKKLHLYVGLPCPWAHRTLIVRALKGLEDSVTVSIAAPGDDASWQFAAAPPPPTATKLLPTTDKANGCKTVRDVYSLRRGGYNGRPTVPLLWDARRNDVICNESYDIITFFNAIGNPAVDLAPPSLAGEIEKWNSLIYQKVNNGVYRCGFAQSQEAYDEAVAGVFAALDTIDDHLNSSRFLCGDDLTLADVCLFTTLIRFDVVYNTLFRCTKKRLIDFRNLYPYVRDIYQIPSVAKTCNLAAVMDGYYKTLFPLNPGGIRPVMPYYCEDEALMKPQYRSSMAKNSKTVVTSVPVIDVD